MRVRVSLAAVGVLFGLAGVYAFQQRVPMPQWPRVGLWLAGGVAAHDAVLAPAAIVAGLVVLRFVPRRAWPVLRTLLLAGAAVAIILFPLAMTA